MKANNWLRTSLAWWFASLVLLGAPVFAQNRYILETTTSADVTRLSSLYGLTLLHTIHEDADSVYVVSLPPSASANVIADIKADPAVQEFVPDSEVDGTENPESTHQQRALDPLSDALAIQGTQTYYGARVRSGFVGQTAGSLIHLAQTQQQFPTGNDIVAVIDTGVDPRHPALSGVLVPGYDFLNDLPGIPSELAGLSQSTVAILDQSTVAILDQKNSPVVLNQSTVAILDQSTVAILDGTKLPEAFGHGTMVSGLIHLVAPTARIMPLKAFQLDGTANLSDVIRAIYYAVDNNAKVINMSFSTTDNSPALLDAVTYATSHGVILIAAVGNDGKEKRVYPAGFHGVYGVGSTDKSDLRSPFSNYGDVVRLAAPGEALVTTYPGNNYAAVWGTSFSAALVSGAAALITSFRPLIQYDELGSVFGKGPRIGLDDGYPRLDLLPSLLYCAQQTYPNPGHGDN
jgi:subtilisin family serine protease